MDASQRAQPEQIDVDVLVRELRITKKEFASATGLSLNAITRKSRKGSPGTQRRLRETIEVLGIVQEWTGGVSAAWSWYRYQPIPALGGLTAEEIALQNRLSEVQAYLRQIAAGGYA